MSCNKCISYERSILPPVSQISPTSKTVDNSFSEYSLKQNVFDPSKSSPPNDFMLKLHLRMSIYNNYNTNNNCTFQNNDDNRVNE
jgi:hypothetical protein